MSGEDLLASRNRGQSEEAVLDAATCGRAASTPQECWEEIEGRVLEKVEGRLRNLQVQIVECLGGLIGSKVEAIVDARIHKALPSQTGTSNPKSGDLKDTLTSVVKTALFDSGLLDRTVERVVGEKLQGASFPAVDSARSPSADAQASLRKECASIVQVAMDESSARMEKEVRSLVDKQTTAFLSSENLKVLIDDKFRAISLYLKTEVIPKAVHQALKAPAPSASK
jgi:hypothetical protein